MLKTNVEGQCGRQMLKTNLNKLKTNNNRELRLLSTVPCCCLTSYKATKEDECEFRS